MGEWAHKKNNNNSLAKTTEEDGCAKRLAATSLAGRTTDLTATAPLRQLRRARARVFWDALGRDTSPASKKLTYKKNNLFLFRRAGRLDERVFWLCAALSENKGAGFCRCTTCPKCSCKGYASGLSHSLLRDCSLRWSFPPCIMVKRKPCIEACSSAASLQQPRWGRDPERCMAHGRKGCE